MKAWYLLTALAAATPLQAETISGHVISIADGDTLTILDAGRRQLRIRISGIDAPEKAQPFGERSKTSLSALAYDQDATADCPKEDRYRRKVCTVTVRGKDIGLEQISTGMAWWYRQYANEQSLQARTDYESAEFMAKAQRLGLWADKNPVPPWDWRRAVRQD